MRIRGLGAAKRVGLWARSVLRPGPLIFGYHRVAESSWDPQHLCVSPENFATQLEIMLRVAEPLSLQQLYEGLQEGRKFDKAFVVTLDDGYADSLETAAPILEKYGVPATVYVTTGMIGKPFWWCEIQHLVEGAATLPEQISIKVGDHQFDWTGRSDTSRNRARLIQSLGDLFRELPFAAQDEALDLVRADFGSDAANRLQVRAMTAEQIEGLSRTDHVEIGSHAVTHTSLNQLSADEQRAELRQSKAELESITGSPVVSFSYPNGRISRQATGIASELGYQTGCTSREELVAPGCNPLLLPRIWAGDWGEEQFERWLWRWRM